MNTDLFIAAFVLLPVFAIFTVGAFVDEVIFEKFPAVEDVFERLYDFLFER